MIEPTEEDLILLQENFIVITLLDGQTLAYPITGQETLYLKRFFDARTDQVPSGPNQAIFLHFSTIYDRQVFIRLSKIVNVLFQYNILQTRPSTYIDNFEVVVVDEEDNEILIPDAIFKMKGKAGLLSYSSLDDTDQYIGIDESTMNDKNFVKYGYIIVQDENAEDNYIPVNKIICAELSRRQVYCDEEWEEIHKFEVEDAIKRAKAINNKLKK